MFKRRKKTTSAVAFNTLIGKNTEIDGNIRCYNAIRIDGILNGLVESDDDILIGETATISGNITGNSVYISGTIEGNVYAKSSIRLFSTSRICGDIQSSSIITDEGAVINGKCNILESDGIQSDQTLSPKLQQSKKEDLLAEG